MMLEQFHIEWPTENGCRAAALVSHFEDHAAHLSRVIVYKSDGIKAQLGRSLQRGKNAPARAPRTIDQHLLDAISPGMKSTYQEIHDCLLDEQREGNQSQAQKYQPPREKVARKEAYRKRDQESLGGNS